jgi:choline-phosphate cytidylyltransferase/glycerol-3-phosphate cytidylyltransferase
MGKGKRKVVYVTGTFDLFHVGHLGFIKRARGYGNFLVVGLNTDEYVQSYKSRPVILYHEREMILRAIRYIDAVYPRESHEDMRIYKKYGSGTRVVGREAGKETDREKLKKYGVRVVCIRRSSREVKQFSTTRIKRRVCDRWLARYIWKERSNGETQVGMADDMGISRHKVAQLEKKAIVRKIIEEGGGEKYGRFESRY